MTSNIVPTTQPTQAMPLFLLLCLFVPLCASAQRADSSDRLAIRAVSEIHGKITITKRDVPDGMSSMGASHGGYSAHGRHDAVLSSSAMHANPSPPSERAVVFVVSDELDRGEYPVTDKTPVLDQKDLQFHPQVLPVLVGTTVSFPNRDNLFHNVFSYSQAKEFDLGRYPQNDSRTVMFDKPGVVRVYCDIHSSMSATILVLQNPFFATPDDNGEYRIRGVPEGKYRLVLWYDRDVVERRSIEVKSGDSIEVNFIH